MTDQAQQPPVAIRPAATVMLVRDLDTDGDGLPDGRRPGIELFMLRRTLKAAFGSGMYVFPGGRVEETDGDDIDAAHRLAAIRECFEEAGVLLAHDANGETVRDGHPALAARHGVHDGDVDIVALCAEHGLTLAVDRLAWNSHWITPKGEGARRFDTRFYVALAPPGQHSVHDDSETIASLWTTPQDALARQEAGELMMMPPTITNLKFLSQFDSAEAALEGARAVGTPECILPKIQFDAEGKIAGILLPGDPGYDDLD